MLKHIISSLVALSVLVPAVFCFPAFVGLMIFLVGLALWEFCRAARNSKLGFRPITLLCIISGIFLVTRVAISKSGINNLALPISLMVLLFMSLELFRSDRAPLRNAFVGIAAVLYIALPASFLLIIRQSQLVDRGVILCNGTALTFLALGMNCLVDTFACFAGRKIGRHKMCKTISPNKSWEGTLVGLIATMVTALGLSRWYGSTVVMIGLIACVAAPIGDLIESSIKRELGIKDMGTIMPGHGGILDRIDSQLMTITCVYLYLSLTGRLV